ncbi:hypothetical protein BJ508DRAFT_326150 [Ascobolus immersus RN42]|uniref:BED-type domain-containing protein n=1 Tax=Ascobolus immersus RN42 TaxID=1160509 RepID=A0A3N4IBV0_ASCIM|nr:hypothetical protein BJ508DRAFT_326150 [Ascobolus immersus RN42]
MSSTIPTSNTVTPVTPANANAAVPTAGTANTTVSETSPAFQKESVPANRSSLPSTSPNARATQLHSLFEGQTQNHFSHIYKPENGTEYWDEIRQEKRWKCNRCVKKLTSYAISGTRCQLDHLEQVHFISRQDGSLIAPENRSARHKLPPDECGKYDFILVF